MRVAELLLAGLEDSAKFESAVDAADETDLAAVLELTDHSDARLRLAVASTLPFLTHGDPPTEQMVAAAIRLTLDTDKKVRDRACFVLAEQWREIDTPEVRDALAARLDDIDRETRSEVLVGLAYRRDPRALPRVRSALSRSSGDVWGLEMVAAGALSDPGLHDLVQRHQSDWSTETEARTAEAVLRLTDPAGPGDDLFDEVAKMYRRRARGLPDGDSSAAWQHLAEMLDVAPHRATEFLQAVLTRVAGDTATENEVRERSALAQLVTEGHA